MSVDGIGVETSAVLHPSGSVPVLHINLSFADGRSFLPGHVRGAAKARDRQVIGITLRGNVERTAHRLPGPAHQPDDLNRTGTVEYFAEARTRSFIFRPSHIGSAGDAGHRRVGD